MIFAYLIGELVSVVGLINEDENVFKQSLDELNVMMIEANLPKDLCKELRACGVGPGSSARNQCEERSMKHSVRSAV